MKLVDSTAKVSKATRIDLNKVACIRCQSRKQKCTGDILTGKKCKNCEKANVNCEYSQKRNPNYIKILESKINHLESILASKENELIFKTESPTQIQRHDESIKHIDSYSDRSSVSDHISMNDGSVLTKCAALFPLKDDMEPLYVGSSGLNIASLLQAHLKLELSETLRQQQKQTTSIEHNKLINDKVIISFDTLLEDKKKLDLYVDNYLFKMHIKYPFLKMDYITEAHENRLVYLKNVNKQQTKSETIKSFTLLMVYAIGSMLTGKQQPHHHGTSEPSMKNDNFLFFTTAMKLNLSVIFEGKSINNIHCMLLVVIYQLRLPNGPVIWDIIESALRLCVSFGFHRKNLQLLHEKPVEYQYRTLTFWSTYSLERSISGSFGRPYSLSDRDIDVDMPINIDESVFDNNTIIEEYYTNIRKGFVVNKLTSRSQAIHNFKFKRIESDIQNEIYRVDLPIDHIPREKINMFIEKMKEWTNTIPQSLSSNDFDYYLYLFNKQIRYLIQPYLSQLSNDDPLFIECMKSSLTVCQLSKRMDHNTKSRFSFIALQTIFLSGATLIYGLLSEKLKWNFSISEGLRCCSSILFSVAERTGACEIFSRLFEKLVNMVEENQQSKINNKTVKEDDIFINNNFDLFGQNNLKKHVQDLHKKENLQFFNEILKTDGSDVDLESLFCFPNLDLLGTNRIDDIIKKTSRDTKFIDDELYFGFV